jgi:hypothetical protein
MCCCASSSTSRASATCSMTTPSLDAAQSLDAAFIKAITSLGWAAGLAVEVQHDVHGVGRWQRATNVWRRITNPATRAERLKTRMGIDRQPRATLEERCVKGSLEFTHSPRFYFNFVPD